MQASGSVRRQTANEPAESPAAVAGVAPTESLEQPTPPAEPTDALARQTATPTAPPTVTPVPTSAAREVLTPTYNNTTCFEPFPFPWPRTAEPVDNAYVTAIAEAARQLIRWRDDWLNPPGAMETQLRRRTLTNLYNERPQWLRLAHEQLDRAVLDACGRPHDVTGSGILDRLQHLNLERPSEVGQATPATSDLEWEQVIVIDEPLAADQWSGYA